MQIFSMTRETLIAVLVCEISIDDLSVIVSNDKTCQHGFGRVFYIINYSITLCGVLGVEGALANLHIIIKITKEKFK